MSEKLGQVKEWAAQVPAFTRFVLVASLPLSILSLISLGAGLIFVNIPYYTLQCFQSTSYSVWRLVTTDFVLPGLFDVRDSQLLTGLLFFAYTAEKAEWRLGTVRYIYYFFVNSINHSAILIQVAYCLLMYVFAILPIVRYVLETPSLGLWSLIMVEAYLSYMKNMNAPVKPFGLLEVKSLFVFVGICVVGVLAVWLWFWPLVLGAGVGFLQEKAKNYEDKAYLLWLKKVGHFVLCSEVKTALASDPSSSSPAQPSNP